jgi:peroxiredoxin Q/BCP
MAAASCAPLMSPDGDETPTSASSSRSARSAMEAELSTIHWSTGSLQLHVMAKGPRVGDTAPDFELVGTDGPFRLSEHRGERVVLLFYPGDETPVCTKQFCSYRDRADDMSALDAVVVGISGQDVESHREFTSNHGLTVPLLADPDKSVARMYGVTRPVLGTQRATFIVDADGTIAWAKIHALGLDYVGVDELAAALASVTPAAAE